MFLVNFSCPNTSFSSVFFQSNFLRKFIGKIWDGFISLDTPFRSVGVPYVGSLFQTQFARVLVFSGNKDSKHPLKFAFLDSRGISYAVSEAGIIILPPPHDEDEDESQGDVVMLEPETTRSKWPGKPGVPNYNLFESEDSWYDRAPEGFSLAVSPFCMHLNKINEIFSFQFFFHHSRCTLYISRFMSSSYHHLQQCGWHSLLGYQLLHWLIYMVRMIAFMKSICVLMEENTRGKLC